MCRPNNQSNSVVIYDFLLETFNLVTNNIPYFVLDLFNSINQWKSTRTSQVWLKGIESFSVSPSQLPQSNGYDGWLMNSRLCVQISQKFSWF